MFRRRPVFVATIGILAAIAIPAYQDHAGRANKGWRSAKANNKVRDAVTQFIVEHEAFPQGVLHGIGLADAVPSSIIRQAGILPSRKLR